MTFSPPSRSRSTPRKSGCSLRTLVLALIVLVPTGASAKCDPTTDPDKSVAALNSMSFADRSDWRVPTVAELLTLVRPHFPPEPADSPGIQHGLRRAGLHSAHVQLHNCSRGAYWSSSSATDRLAAWDVVFGISGGAGPSIKTNGHYVRAVRGGSELNSEI